MAHPDNPESADHRLYRALDYIADSKAEEKEQSKKLSLTSNLEQGAAVAVASTFTALTDPMASKPALPSSAPLAIKDGQPEGQRRRTLESQRNYWSLRESRRRKRTLLLPRRKRTIA